MNHAEEVLYAHLTEVDSLDVLAKEGFSLGMTQEVIPTELGRKIVTWALDYYFANGRKVAPTREAIHETWGDEMEKVELSLGDDTETDSIEWAIDQLRTQYAVWKSQDFVKRFATSVATADPTEKVEAIQSGAFELYSIAQGLVSHRREATAGAGFEEALLRHKERSEAGRAIYGLTLGLPAIDEHIHGIHEGELAIFAAASGMGKSWLANKVLFHEWRQHRRAVLITLENDLPMTFDRMACMQARVLYDRWQRGEATEGDLLRVAELRDQLLESEYAPLVIMPERGDRTVMNIVRKAITVGAQSLIIDQLSFVEPNPGSSRRQGWEIIGDQVHELKSLISEGRDRLPCLLINQIKQEGLDRARKTGRYAMDDLAGGREIDRTADFVFSACQSDDDKIVNQATWQMLKGRRVPVKDWVMAWRLEVGDIRVRHEVAEAV